MRMGEEGEHASRHQTQAPLTLPTIMAMTRDMATAPTCPGPCRTRPAAAPHVQPGPRAAGRAPRGAPAR